MAALMHSAACGRHVAAAAHPVPAASSSAVLGLAPRRRNAQGSSAPRTSVRSQGTMETISAVSQLASTAAVCVGAYMLLQQSSGPLPEQDNYDERGRECPVCSGSGYEPCLCNKWSDGDVGCSSCSKTGYMRCRGCGGGGRAVPLLVKLRKESNNLQ